MCFLKGFKLKVENIDENMLRRIGMIILVWWVYFILEKKKSFVVVIF